LKQTKHKSFLKRKERKEEIERKVEP